MADNVVKTESHTKLEVAKVSHTWTISNFSCYAGKNGEMLKSETFSVAKGNWRLELYPKGESDDDKDYVSIFLRFLSCNEEKIEAEVKIAISTIMHGLRNITSNNVFNEENIWGCSKFIQRDFLLDRTRKLLSDEKFTIFCEITVVVGIVNVPSKGLPPKSKDPVIRLLKNLERLFENPKFSDVVITVGRREFQAHKAILAECSPVFSAMFEHEMKEGQCNRVNIIDIDNEVVEEMLRFIYTSKAPNIEKIADSLLVAADKYALDSLKLMCEERLYKSLTVENAADTLVFADIQRCDSLKTQIIDFIKMHGTAVMDTEGFKSMTTSHLHLILEILHASVSK